MGPKEKFPIPTVRFGFYRRKKFTKTDRKHQRGHTLHYDSRGKGLANENSPLQTPFDDFYSLQGFPGHNQTFGGDIDQGNQHVH